MKSVPMKYWHSEKLSTPIQNFPLMKHCIIVERDSIFRTVQHKCFRFASNILWLICLWYNILALSVPDECYFVRTWWRLFCSYLMNVILFVPDECYFVRTWWMLFCSYLMNVILFVPDEGYFVRTWWRLFCSYLMNVIPETRRVH